MALLSKEDIARAEANGIGYHTLVTRVRSNGWDIEEAITTPVKKHDSPWAKWKAIAKENGISSSVFYTRLKRGWESEKAAITPLATPGQYDRNAKITKQDIEEAKANGIGETTLNSRVYLYRWSVEEAKTIPVGTKRRNKRGLFNTGRL